MPPHNPSHPAHLRAQDLEDPRALQEALSELAGALREAGEGLKGEEEPLARRAEALELIERKLSPGLAGRGAYPCCVALLGGTNTGKSSTLNALAGRVVSAARVTANATKSPLVYAHERYASVLLEGDALVSPRPSQGPDEALSALGGTLVALHQDPRLEAVALIDCPDLDSTAQENAAAAREALALADVCVWVTTPQKYKDALLVEAARATLAQGKPLWVLFNLTEEGADFEEMRADLAALLEAPGAGEAGGAGGDHSSQGARFTPPIPPLRGQPEAHSARAWRALGEALTVAEPHEARAERLGEALRATLTLAGRVAEALERRAEGRDLSARVARALAVSEATRLRLPLDEGARGGALWALLDGASAERLAGWVRGLAPQVRRPGASEPSPASPPARPPAAHQELTVALGALGATLRFALSLGARVIWAGSRALSRGALRLVGRPLASEDPAERARLTRARVAEALSEGAIEVSLAFDRALGEAHPLAPALRSPAAAQARAEALRTLTADLAGGVDPEAALLRAAGLSVEGWRPVALGLKIAGAAALSWLTLGLGVWDLAFAPLGASLAGLLSARVLDRRLAGAEEAAARELLSGARAVGSSAPLAERLADAVLAGALSGDGEGSPERPARLAARLRAAARAADRLAEEP